METIKKTGLIIVLARPMGLYEKEFDFDFAFGKLKSKSFLTILAFAVAILVLIFLAVSVFQAKAINATLNDNPLNLKEKPFTMMNLVITNITPLTARDVQVTVKASDSKSIIIGTNSEETERIDLIESGLNRKIHFLIVPKQGIKEGKYRIIISTEMNGTKFEESVEIEVIPA